MGGETVMDGDGKIYSKSSSRETSLSPQSTLKTFGGRAQHIFSGGDEALPPAPSRSGRGMDISLKLPGAVVRDALQQGKLREFFSKTVIARDSIFTS